MAPRRTLLALSLALITLLAGSPVPTTAGETSTANSDIQKPVKIHAQLPAYPEAAKKERIQGQVVATMVINTQGQVESVEIVESVGEDFDAAVREALMDWEFEPARLRGELVSVFYKLTVNFTLTPEGARVQIIPEG